MTRIALSLSALFVITVAAIVLVAVLLAPYLPANAMGIVGACVAGALIGVPASYAAHRIGRMEV